eukprot:TRINITY_DN34906_c0_g1_i1.p1 TRINITY_DN34906_c0_g1~~TRINITY_DN34906_c0_g1_i1.p1  ORF type:complete len:140 (-),score=48.41 TRINITY_DN34906_c0_g1_i1:145-564(-)
MLGLIQLGYFARTYQQRFRDIVQWHSAQHSTEHSLPVACVGVNITATVDAMLEDGAVRTVLARHEPVEEAVHELYCCLFCVLHSTWQEEGLCVDQFNHTLESLSQAALAQVRGGGCWGLLQLRQAMRAQPEPDRWSVKL